MNGNDIASLEKQAAYARGQQAMEQGATRASDQCSSGEGLTGSVNPKRCIGFSFSDALERVKNGRRMSRIGWNGHGQFIFLVFGSDPSDPDERAPLLSGINSRMFGYGDRGTTRRLPHVALHNSRGESVPWAPSQSDMLAEDWITV